MEPRTRSDYTTRAVDAAYSVLIELFGMLGEFRDHIAVIGGWVPALLLPEAKDQVRTLDVDLAVDFEHISDDTYATLLRAIPWTVGSTSEALLCKGNATAGHTVACPAVLARSHFETPSGRSKWRNSYTPAALEMACSLNDC